MTTPQQQRSLATYENQQIETASPEQLLLMLYDGAIRFLNEALRAMREEDWETYNAKLIKAQNIVSELMASLDVKLAGELGQNLFKLYDYIHYRLVQANMKKDEAMVNEALMHLKDLRVTWGEAVVIAKKEKQFDAPKASTVLNDDNQEERVYSA